MAYFVVYRFTLSEVTLQYGGGGGGGPPICDACPHNMSVSFRVCVVFCVWALSELMMSHTALWSLCNTVGSLEYRADPVPHQHSESGRYPHTGVTAWLCICCVCTDTTGCIWESLFLQVSVHFKVVLMKNAFCWGIHFPKNELQTALPSIPGCALKALPLVRGQWWHYRWPQEWANKGFWWTYQICFSALLCSERACYHS